MTEAALAKEEPSELSKPQTLKSIENNKQVMIQDLVESLKSTADDIGQISELSSEEKILVSQFFASFTKLVLPLVPSIRVSQSALPSNLGDVVEAHIDPSGHLILQFEDGHVELRSLVDEKNRDLMISIVCDIVPKIKNFTGQQKHKLEDRIKLLSNVTKEIQKSSEALSSAIYSE